MLLKLAWRNIWRNKRRTFITLTSIAFAVLLSSIMRSLQLGSYERMVENAVGAYTGYVQVQDTAYWDDKTLDNSFAFDAELPNRLEQLQHVEHAIPRIESFVLTAYGHQSKGALLMGIEPESEDHLSGLKKKLVKGEYLEDQDQSVLVAEGLADYLKIGLGDTLVLISQGYHGANAAGIYTVKGILKFPSPQQNKQMVYLPLEAAQWFFAAEGMLTNISLKISHPNYTAEVKAEVGAQLNNDELVVLDWKEMMPELVQSIELDNVSGKIMLYLLYLVIGFGMFGTFLMMTSERMYEFGIMTAVGMKKYKMQLMIAMEFGLMSLFGVLVGLGMSFPFISYFHHNPVRLTGPSAEIYEKFGVEPIYAFSMDAALFYDQAWTVFFLTIILGAYPLWVVQRLKIIKAMRS